MHDVVARGDFASRAFIIELEDVPAQYKTEAELWAEFEQDAPLIMGALLDALSVGLRRV